MVSPKYKFKNSPISFGVINRKGGCGKTSSAVTFAALLNKECGYKNVVLVDLDGQCSASLWFAQAFNGQIDLPFKNTVKDYIDSNGEIPLSDIARKVTFYRAPGDVYYASLESKDLTLPVPTGTKPATRSCTVTLIPGDDDIDNVSIGNPDILKRLVLEVAGDDPENTIVLFDCPPQYMPAVSLVMTSGCYIISPVPPSNDAIMGIPSILETVAAARSAGYDARFLGLYIWGLDQRESMPKELAAALRKNLSSDILFSGSVKRYSAFERARGQGTPLCIYEYLSPAYVETTNLINEILDRVKKIEEEEL